MVSTGRIIATFLKLVPLAIYVRAACCKFDLPILGCDGPRCPYGSAQMAERMIGIEPIPANASCMATGNTAEVRHWCEHGWVAWLNTILRKSRHTEAYTVTCSEAKDFVLLKALGGLELLGYVLLWVRPQLGALWLTVFMGFGLHYHMAYLKETAGSLSVQIALALFFSSVLVLFLEADLADNEAVPGTRVPSTPRSADTVNEPRSNKDSKNTKVD